MRAVLCRLCAFALVRRVVPIPISVLEMPQILPEKLDKVSASP